MLLCAAFGDWPSLPGQFLLWCHPEAVAKAYWSSSDTTNDVDTCFDCRGSREGAQGDVFLLRATLPAEDEVLVTAAGKNGDGEALRRKASCEAGHRVWLHCIILVLEALALSPQSFAKSRAGAVFARVGTPSYNMRESSSIYIYLNVRFVNFVDIGTTVLSLWTAKIARLPMMEPGDQGLPNHLGSTKGRVACLWRRRTTRRRPCVVKGKDQAKHDQPRSRNQTKVAEETPR